MINPSFLKTFVTLVETQSFTRTAARLGMTQPGVSQHLRWLEEYFGATLIERRARTFEVTDEGQRVLAYGQQLFAEHEAFRQSLSRDEPTAGPCRFASPGSFGMRMYSFLLELNARHRGLSFWYAYAPNTSILADVVEGRIDMGFVTKKTDDAGLVWTKIEDENLCLVVPKRWRDPSYERLLELGFVNHPDGFHHAARLLQENYPDQFRTMEDFPVRGHINQIQRILEPVALGLGFTALPEFACKAFPDQERLAYVPLPKPVIDPIYAVHKRARVLPARFTFVLEQYKRWRLAAKDTARP